MKGQSSQPIEKKTRQLKRRKVLKRVRTEKPLLKYWDPSKKVVIGVLTALTLLCAWGYILVKQRRAAIAVERADRTEQYRKYLKVRDARKEEIVRYYDAKEEWARINTEVKPQIERAVANFLSAKSPAVRLAYCRHPRRIKALMDDYYAKHEMTRFSRRSVFKVDILSRNPEWNQEGSFRRFHLVDVTVDDYRKIMLAEVTKTGNVLIDWEALVYYTHEQWVEYVEEKRPEPRRCRVRVRLDHHYLAPYDEETYLALDLSHIKSKQGSLAYIRRDHPKIGQLNMVLKKSHFKKRFSYILELEMPIPKEGRQAIVVKDIVTGGGFYLEPTP